MYSYLFAMTAYLAVACAVWMLALLLSLFPATRAFAKRSAAGVAGSFPGLLLSQLLCAPVVGGVLLLFKDVIGLERLSDAGRDAVAFSAVIVPALAAGWSFVAGWRAAWAWAAGRSWRLSLETDWVFGPLLRRSARRG